MWHWASPRLNVTATTVFIIHSIYRTSGLDIVEAGGPLLVSYLHPPLRFTIVRRAELIELLPPSPPPHRQKFL